MKSPRIVHAPLALSLLTTLTASLALVLMPGEAEACGGTFCDTGPTVMPVDQSGENILFWTDDSGAEPYTEAHIQIQYEGDPERFAWIIPVTGVPEVQVGSQGLFDGVLDASTPTFTINTRLGDDCVGAGANVGLCAFSSDGSLEVQNRGETGFGEDEMGEEGGGPEILDRGFAGAFEYVVLTGDTVESIVDWLDVAGYAQDEDAPPILQEYLDEGFVFVAVKLQSGVGVDEIHPLSIRYPGTEPCIPIRLTRIAATEDMAIRAFFLGEARVVPQNWPHVVPNLLHLDWAGSPAADYNQMISLALDEAGGRGFVTEYAGTDSVVNQAFIRNPAWSAGAFAELEASKVVDVLEEQGLISCYAQGNDWQCDVTHAQVLPLLRRYLPAPDDLGEAEFWGCLDCFVEDIDPVAWGMEPGFREDFQARIVGPAEHALDMLDDSAYLTRLFTLLSPHEMLEDPVFHSTDSMPTVDNSVTVGRVLSCNDSPDYFEIGDQIIALDGGAWPSFDDMPRVERVERVPMTGPAQIETDNSEEIDVLLDDWNGDQLQGPSGWNCSVDRLRPEALLTMMAIFGIAGFQRRRRRRAVNGAPS